MTARVNTRRMQKLKDEFFELGKRLADEGDSAANCWLCGMEIDYAVPPSSTPDSHNLDHYYPVADYPELQEDPANFRHAHAECNGRRSNKAPLPGLGILSRAWV